MKNIKIDFYDRQIDISLPDNTFEIEGLEPPVLSDPKGSVIEALANPRGMDRISDIVKKGDKVTIVFDN